MKSYGITGKLIDWFSSYLKGRRQKVVIKNNSSAYYKISAGVPQDSFLGPELNDISHFFDHMSISFKSDQ
jgi:hypothetical protein